MNFSILVPMIIYSSISNVGAGEMPIIKPSKNIDEKMVIKPKEEIDEGIFVEERVYENKCKEKNDKPCYDKKRVIRKKIEKGY